MPCFFPLQASYRLRADNKREIKFSNTTLVTDNVIGDYMRLPCGRCNGCKLERSRQWAIRCMHEASLYDDNCFITLTFDDKHLLTQCRDGSLDRSHMQLFMKRLRYKFSSGFEYLDKSKDIKFYSSDKIRVFYCGEYGDRLGRPHYHAVLFGCDFPDKKYWKSVDGYKYYVSEILSELWPFGFTTIGACSFQTAAYVARYCTKKITGVKAVEHYAGRLPEFGQASLRPGIGSDWFSKFKMDLYPSDECVFNGVKSKPPRFYDKKLEQEDPVMFERIKSERRLSAQEENPDNSYQRLAERAKCNEARMKLLVRKMERTNERSFNECAAAAALSY